MEESKHKTDTMESESKSSKMCQDSEKSYLLFTFTCSFLWENS